MTRAIEGTTLGGYICDERSCGRVAVYSPVVCVPYEGFAVEVRPPIIGFVDTHVRHSVASTPHKNCVLTGG